MSYDDPETWTGDAGAVIEACAPSIMNATLTPITADDVREWRTA